MNRKTYRPKEVCLLANISSRQLGYWKLIGIVRPGQELHGSRFFYRYSERDIDLLKAVQKLTEQGYLVSKAADNIKAALANGEEISAQAIINIFSAPPSDPPASPTTGPKGMELLQKCLEEELIRSRRFKYSLSCLAIRIDVLPSDNEDVVRQVIQKAEKVFTSYKRAYDLVVQVGRQEFLWLLCQTTAENARRVAQRVPQMFPDREWFSVPVKYSIRIRSGAGTIDPSRTDGADLVSRARAALADEK
jgi:DNA-binding transcriptional MerR regulator